MIKCKKCNEPEFKKELCYRHYLIQSAKEKLKLVKKINKLKKLKNE